MYKIALSESATKDLDRLNEPILNNIIMNIENLKAKPRNSKVIKLQGKKNEYRLKVGNYRVLFTISDSLEIVRISRILHRKDAYK